MFEWKRKKRERIAEDVVRIREMLKEEQIKYRMYFNNRFLGSPFQFPVMEGLAEIRIR